VLGDAVLAGVLAVVALVQVLTLFPIASPTVGAAIALGSTVPIAWRRRHPAIAALVGTLPWIVPVHGFLIVGYIAAVLLFYSLTANGTENAVAVVVVVIAVVCSVVGGAEQAVSAGEYVGGALAVVAPAGVGLLVRAQRERAARLEEITTLLERERDQRERAAVADERARIARELHDLVSHALVVVSVQADAAQAALEQDPAQARQPLDTIRSSAQEALTEMRRLLGVLRTDLLDPGREPPPGLAQLPALIERAHAANVRADLVVDGIPGTVPQSVDLTAYRIVQEALTNVGKHARGAPATVSILWREDALEIRVRDAGPGQSGPPSPDAHGIVGMRERVRIHRGRFRAGTAEGGGYEVSAVLPLEAP
jgi:signal transduction histidine kinase